MSSEDFGEGWLEKEYGASASDNPNYKEIPSKHRKLVKCPQCKNVVRPIRKIGRMPYLEQRLVPFARTYGEFVWECPTCGYTLPKDEDNDRNHEFGWLDENKESEDKETENKNVDESEEKSVKDSDYEVLDEVERKEGLS
jgi:DNA-directed RNA polymerase subunit M/transcription elongation factor TFIIS